MKIPMSISFALIFCFTIFGQTAKPAPTADGSASQVQTIVLSEEKSIFAEIEVNERIMGLCTDGGALDCKKAENATGDLYSRLVRFPNVLDALLADRQ